MFNELGGDYGYNDPDPEELEATWETWQPDPINTEAPSYNTKIGASNRILGTCSQSRRRVRGGPVAARAPLGAALRGVARGLQEVELGADEARSGIESPG